MDLDSMKYAELQQLAKSVGLKANTKADKLLKVLKWHFERKESSENDDAKSPGEEEEDGGKRSSKRRKVSSAKDTETPAPEMKSESADDNAVAEESDKDVVKKTGGKIPRHEGLMKKKAALRPTTPNFKKLHEAHFNKMESIDSYLQRRNKQLEVLRNSVKDLKAELVNSIKESADTKTRAKPPVSRASLFSPGMAEKKAEKKRRVTRAPAGKPAMKGSAPFRPSILSANKINVRFSQTTQDNEHKRSLVKTPARMSPMLPLTPTPARKSEVHANKNAAPVNKTPGLTPFVFSGASGTPASNKKNTFDLKASLSRPLTYKPHKGKLKPFGATQENAELNKAQTLPSHQKNYKQHQVQTL
ncbi:hypothetical protein PGIGA_G00193350 [Pangasianodon gigas]|uniref:Uncharacterized protein n=1 Tax=Pangasianodon gigas TaxID=30993 RepID=A0ACC5WE32_PANGG|nr:hypothetical protein [Pangasianodon gigas]